MPDLARMSLWLNLKTVAALIFAVVAGAFAVGVLLTNVQRDVAAVRSDLADAVRRGVEQRENIARQAASSHQQQQAEIDRVRLEQQAAATAAAEVRADMRHIMQSLARLENAIGARPGGR